MLQSLRNPVAGAPGSAPPTGTYSIGECVELFGQVATATADAENLEQCLKPALQATCRFMHWQVGHAYLSEPGLETMESARIWHWTENRSQPGRREFTEASESVAFAPGQGMIGKVMESGSWTKIADVRVHPGFVRASAAASLGLKGAFAFPVVAGADVVAVLEFFTEEEAELDSTLAELMAFIGDQLARVYERQQSAQALETIATDFETAVRGAVAKVTDAAARMQDLSDRVSTEATGAVGQQQQLTDETLAMTEMLDTVRAASERLDQSVESIRGHAVETEQSARESRQVLETGHQAMNEFSEAILKIKNIAESIDRISGQTHLLALNAAIEAAHAGDTGHGFAVVAREVKSLAASVSSLSRQIGDEVTAFAEATKISGGAFESAMDTMNALLEAAERIREAVEQHNRETGEIVSISRETAARSESMRHSLDAVGSAGHAVADAADGVRTLAGNVAAEGGKLETALDRFEANFSKLR